MPLLLITCPDEPGLIHTITGGLLGQQLNILRNDEFVERAAGAFFMRTEFALPASMPGRCWPGCGRRYPLGPRCA